MESKRRQFSNKLVGPLLSWLCLAVIGISPVPIYAIGGQQTLSPGHFRHRPQVKKMTKQTRTQIAAGSWAGNGIRLEIGDKGAVVQLSCAEGEITERLMAVGHGNFIGSGTYTGRTAGPQREGGGDRQDVTYSGRLDGKTMSMKIVNSRSGETIGEFELELNKRTRLQRCL